MKTAWDEKFDALKIWRESHGHTCVPTSHPELGSWVSKQRQSRKQQTLSVQRQALLDGIGFTWSSSDSEWEAKFAQLCVWKAKNGHALVPFSDGALGWWSNTQRQSRKKGKLGSSREARLKGIGFVWNPSHHRARGTRRRVVATSDSASSVPKPLRGELGDSYQPSDFGPHMVNQAISTFSRDVPGSEAASSSLMTWDDRLSMRNSVSEFQDSETSKNPSESTPEPPKGEKLPPKLRPAKWLWEISQETWSPKGSLSCHPNGYGRAMESTEPESSEDIRNLMTI